MAKITYASSGVDVAAVKKMQNKVNDLVFSASNEHALPVKGHYAGLFKVGNSTLTMHCDGVGSKVLVAEEMGKYDTVGIDAIAMNVNDLICIGSKPIVAVDYLALAESDEALVLEIMKGLVAGARESGVALIGGETAILPDMIKGGKKPFDLAVTCVGIMEREMITGSALKTGDAIIGLESSGIHSNGYTLARKALSVDKWGRQMLEPTRIYVKPVLEMLDACDVHGIAHITGGAFSKLMRIGAYAKKGFVLDNMPEPAPVFSALAEKVQDEREMHRTFNMGVGMCIMAPEAHENKLISIARRHRIKAQRVGTVTDRQDVVLKKDGREISLI
jgi:phosphoribosylformylglycinamidine cyclo-ligase